MSKKTTTNPIDETQELASAGHWQQIVSELIQGVVLVDGKGQITWANQAALDAHGCACAPELLINTATYRKRFALRYLNHHPLTAKQYPLARLAAGDTFDDVTVVLTREDQPEFERVLRLRSMPVSHEQDHLESSAFIIDDISEQASAEERFERAFASNPAPALVLRLTDSRYIKVNQGFLHMTGFKSDEVTGRAFHELDVLKEAEHRDAAVSALREHATIAQQEAVVPVKEGRDKFVIVAGQPIEMEGAACMMFTFADLDQRKQTESSLRASEANFRTAFQLAPVPLLICDQDDWQILETNEAFAAISGYPIESLSDKSLTDLMKGRQKRLPTELRATLHEGTGIRNREIDIMTENGVHIDCLLSMEPINVHDKTRLLCAVQDVTERKRSESDLFEAIEEVMKDASWFARSIIEKLAQVRQVSGNDSSLATLTARERQVLELVCKGQSNTQIAAGLGLSANTVRNHVATLYSKIGVNRRSAAVIWGRERGLAAY